MTRRHFTIIELLVAIGLMSVLANLLSTVYVKMSQYAVEQASTISAYDETYSLSGKLHSDFSRIKLPAMQGTGTSQRTFRLAYDNVSVLTPSAGSYINTLAGPYPYLVYTAERYFDRSFFENLSSSDGYSEIGYLCAPSSKVTISSLTGVQDINLCSLYRIENLGTSTSLFDINNFIYASGNVIAENVIWVSYDFKQYQCDVAGGGAMSDNPWSSRQASDSGAGLSLDSSSSFPGNSNTLNKIPDEVNMTITVAPHSGPFPLTAINAISVPANEVVIGSGGTSVDISFDRSFPLSDKGHILNVTTEQVYWYERVGLNTINIFDINSSSSPDISAGDELATGISFSKRFSLQ